MSKIAEFMKGRGKALKPKKGKADKKNLTGKEKNALLLQMLEDFGYIE